MVNKWQSVYVANNEKRVYISRLLTWLLSPFASCSQIYPFSLVFATKITAFLTDCWAMSLSPFNLNCNLREMSSDWSRQLLSPTLQRDSFVTIGLFLFRTVSLPWGVTQKRKDDCFFSRGGLDLKFWEGFPTFALDLNLFVHLWSIMRKRYHESFVCFDSEGKVFHTL